MIWLFISMLFLIKSCNPNPGADLKLHYDRPATCFEEALPLGNGQLGAMVYGDPVHERISLNDITLRSDETYLPLGTLHIEYPQAEITDYSRVLDISTATAIISYKRDGNPVRIHCFVSAPDSALVINIQADKPIEFKLTLDSPLPHEIDGSPKEILMDGYAPYHANLYDPERGIHFRTFLAASADGRIMPDLQGGLDLYDIRYATICLANATSYNGPDKDPVKEGRPYKKIVGKQLMRAFQKGFKATHEALVKDYQTLFNSASPDLGNYLLISSTHTTDASATPQLFWSESID